MSAARRPLVAGNWKMNGLKHSGAELLAMADGYDATLKAKADLLICPPATLVALLSAQTAGSGIAIGGQDCHAKATGAHTGDISAEMLKDAGAGYVIVGHSERRTDHGESDAAVHAKAEAAWRAGLTAIVCVGETRQEREAGSALAVVAGQVRGSVPAGANAGNLVIAYEPVWAIGTGLVPTVGDVEEMHGEIRKVLAEALGGEAGKVRILYGGSVKPDNAATLLNAADVDGALVGGASLKAIDFLAIARAYA
ncbi:triose-phosphate isomerase [Aquabacter sediminis]|uniref:triose-phosphate isomerase n=1 Tax=Aquabacter sediminis TaxID=3029197 RepID=UPI00237EA30D|nr:triose-phosphate isomerase [Aquabacter sp. P-9]MDE1566693.1 triose-phosphate isomerase [Aquabacter sp. P-9]